MNTNSTSITRRQALKTVTVAALGAGLAGRLAAQDTNAALHAADASRPRSPTAIRHSDVIFMGAQEKAIYEIYGATVVSWGSRPNSDEPKVVAWFSTRVGDACALGIRYCAGAAFRTAFAGMMDFDPDWRASLCLNLEGNPFTIPWLWDNKHKETGEPAYWFCSSAPGIGSTSSTRSPSPPRPMSMGCTSTITTVRRARNSTAAASAGIAWPHSTSL